MKKQKKTNLAILKKREPLRVGFLPENDCAPVVVAYEFGLFKDYGVEVELQSWDGMIHVFQMFPELVEAHRAVGSLSEFLRKHLRIQTGSQSP